MRSTNAVAEIVRISGMSTAALSGVSGVSRSLIEDWLEGRSEPSVAELEQLADTAGCALEVAARPQTQPVPEAFVAVLEFGELFPRKDPEPLVNLGPMWRRVQNR
ncbi:MAG TPA: helix-turn-helix transcriptional regulator [Nocardioides sp.]|uniref:helix-turn-helix domain-containing protein n=1 Tax=Nocardioides sp. TaxID=35761 RepID=UPI002B6A7F15|nr:helix-turn-helix transcriptional regulator [Nocardioides sp.]HTW16146.1 helix-turn-helix transcriptional regulator [Nocardioides sp.]